MAFETRGKPVEGRQFVSMKTIDPSEIASIESEIKEAVATKNGRLDFTVEHGRGETYATPNWTVYAHDSYPRHSVLYGRRRRRWVGALEDSSPEGLAALEAVLKRCKVKFSVSGCTFRHDPMHDIPDTAD